MAWKHGKQRLIGPAVASGGVTLVPAAAAPVLTTTSLAGDMSASIVGAAISTAGKRAVTLEFVWTDVGGAQDPVGVFGVAFSNEYDPVLNPSVTFTSYTLAAADTTGMTPATTSGRWAIKVFLTGEGWIRPFYTRTSGAGTATCTASVTD